MSCGSRAAQMPWAEQATRSTASRVVAVVSAVAMTAPFEKWVRVRGGAARIGSTCRCGGAPARDVLRDVVREGAQYSPHETGDPVGEAARATARQQAGPRAQ